MNTLVRSLFAITLIIVFDAIWLTLQSGMYKELVFSIQNKPIKLNFYGVAFTYLFMFLSLIFIVFPSVDQDTTTKNVLLLSLKHAAMFGLIAYGIYSFTNFAAFSDYTIKVAVLDTIWGAILYFFAVAIVLAIVKKKI